MKHVLVTGANKGIGLALSEAILQEQAEFGVIMGSRDLQRGQVARDALLARSPEWEHRINLVQLDVSSDQSVANAIASLGSTPPALCGLVNNAGVGTGALQDILDVNVHGVRRVCEAFGPIMDKGSRIVNVTSAAGPNFVTQCDEARKAFFLDPALEWNQLQSFMNDCIELGETNWDSLGIASTSRYGLSKACANSYSQYFARKHPHLTVNACTPGFIATDLGLDFLGGRTPAEAGMKTPAEGARVIMFLLFGDPVGSGHYYGSDSLRSPMDRYRAPGSPAYTGN